MTKKVTLFFSVLLLSLIFSGCFQKKETLKQDEVIGSPAPKIEKQMEQKEQTKNDVFENAPMIVLVDVASGKSSGDAWITVKSGKTFHRVVAKNLPELTNGDFYEGWLVKVPASGGFLSTGEMIFDEESEEWILEHEERGDKSEYRSVVITLEPDDGNPAPAKHILEGEFATEVNFEVE